MFGTLDELESYRCWAHGTNLEVNQDSKDSTIFGRIIKHMIERNDDVDHIFLMYDEIAGEYSTVDVYGLTIKEFGAYMENPSTTLLEVRHH